MGVKLDFKLTFEDHLNNVLAKVNKVLGLLRKVRILLPKTTLITIYKAFIRSHLDYGNVPFNQVFNNSFKEKPESIQYSACLTLPVAIRGKPKEKVYEELGLESLQERRWCRKLCVSYKFLKNENPRHFFSFILTRRLLYLTRNIHNIPFPKAKHNFSKKIYFYQP